MDDYCLGDWVTLRATYTDRNGQEHQPGAVYFLVMTPSEALLDLWTMHYWGTGMYEVQFPASESGLWRYRSYSTGDGQAAEEGQLLVKESVFIYEEDEGGEPL